MIRPLTMSNSIHFGGYTITGGDNEKQENQSSQTTEQPSKKFGLTNNEKNIFLAGAFLGAVMGIGGTMLHNASQTESFMNDMKEETLMGKIDTLKVEDVTDDKVPDIILVGDDGISTIYDVKNNKVLLNMDGDMIEKIR